MPDDALVRERPTTLASDELAHDPARVAHIPREDDERTALCGRRLAGPQRAGGAGRCVVCLDLAQRDRFVRR